MTNTNNSNAILKVHGLTNNYSGTPLLRNIQFDLDPGEILCLLGPSGSGKTTLLRLIAGLEKNYSGSIHFQGIDVRSRPPHKRGFGLMFQEYALFPHKNVEENVAFGLEMQKLPASQQQKRVNKMLQLVGLTGFNDRRIDELSGGEQQRVALARSLAPEPKLLLLDEPLGSLDRTLRERLTVEIRAILKKLQLTAVFVTHDQSEAFGISDKVAVLQAGMLQQFAPPEQLYRYPANENVAAFLGFTNIFRVTIKRDSNRILSPFGEIAYPDLQQITEDQPLLLIRPEGAVVCTKSQENGSSGIFIEGVVTERRYQGSCYAVQLFSKGHSLMFNLPLDPTPPLIGDNIFLFVTLSSLHLIEA